MRVDVKQAGLRILFTLNIFLIILLSGSNLAAYADPDAFWALAILSLLFPLFFSALVLFTLFWLFFSKKKALLCLVFIAISLPALLLSFAFHLPQAFIMKKQQGSIRVMSWNVGLMNFTAPDSVTAIRENRVIFNEIKNYNADIICMQEFFSAIVPGSHYNICDSIARMMGYPYHFFSLDNPYFTNKDFYSGCIIYSKYPFTDTIRSSFANSHAGGLLQAGILLGTDTINVYTTRLQSMNLKQYEYTAINNIKKADHDAFKGSGSLLRKLRYAYEQKAAQVQLVRSVLNNNSRPTVFTGDFNDVPVSFAYRQIRGNMQDAWLTNGAGIGRTFKFISPTLRIDNIFFSDIFTSLQTTRIITTASDHYGLVTDLAFTKKPRK